jgi:hypothetical protein
MPAIGHFLTRDTWGGDANRPMSYNRWNYGYSNPIKYTDPSGHCPLPLDNSDPCWQLLLKIESQFSFIDLQTDLSSENYWTYDELLDVQKDLERYDQAANISLSTLYPDDVRIKRVREFKLASGGGFICGGTPYYFTKWLPITIYTVYTFSEKGCIIHELAHYLDRANLHLAKPFEKFIGASTSWLGKYNTGPELPPIYGSGEGIPPNRMEDFAESLKEYVQLKTNYVSLGIGLIAGQKRWNFIESLLDTGKICSGPLKLDSFFVILRGWSDPDE